MPNTPRMVWPYPSEGTDPWFDAFESLVQAVDVSVAASREDRNIVLMNGGDLSFDAGTGVLSWSAPIELLAPNSGFLWSIPVGSITLADGEIAYVNLARNPTDNTNLSVARASVVPSSDDAFAFAIRRDHPSSTSRIYFRNGAVLLNGQTAAVLRSGSALGSTGQKLTKNVTFATNGANTSSTPLVVGANSLDLSDYNLSGTSRSVKFKVVGSVSGEDMSGEAVLYNLTDASTVATLTWTETTSTAKLSADLTTVSAGEKLFEVRIRLATGTGTFVAMWAGLEIENTF